MSLESKGGGEDSSNKKWLSLDGLVSDSHLSREEIKIISEAFEKDREKVLEATRGELRNFIVKDYGAANMQSLGGFDGVVALQKALKVDPSDGSFGPDTFKALIEYQKATGLKPDGIAGWETQRKLGISVTVVKEWEAAPILHKQKYSRTEKRDGWTKGNIVTTSESLPKIDTAKILGKYETRLKGLQDSLSEIRKHRDENTGFFNVLGDDLVGAFWGETGKAIYERSYQAIKSQAKGAIIQMDTDMKDRQISTHEWNQYLNIRIELEKCLGQKLGEPNPFLNMGVSLQYWGEEIKNGFSKLAEINRTIYWSIIESFPDWKLKTLMSTWAAKKVGNSRWLWDVFWGVLDLASGIFKYAWSSEYRAHVSKIMDLTGEYIDKNWYWWTAWVIFSKVWNEMKKINELPLDKQAEAFGRLEGNIAGMIATGWVIGVLGKARWASTAASEALSSAAEVAQSAGKLEQAAALGAQASREAMKATVYKIGTFILNGPAESAIGAVLSNTFRSVYTFLRWGASIADKLKTVEKGIADFSEAMKREKNPENLKYFQEATEALESERNKLMQQEVELKRKNPSETSNPNSTEAKKFVTEGKSDKQIYRELQQYYNTSRPNSAHHPQAEEIAKELSLIKERMKKWENVRSDLETLAKDPDGYLKRKNPVEHREMTPHEKFMDGLKKYQEQFSESFLRGLAQKDARAFGEALLHQHILEDIKVLAKTNPEQAMNEFNAFMKSPDWYLTKKFSIPYVTVESEIQNYAKQAYSWKYRTEWEMLRANNQKAIEEYFRANPELKIATSEIQKLADSLRAKFKNLAEELDKILASIVENAGVNLKWVGEKIDAFLEKIRLVPEMSLNMKSGITNKLRAIREKYLSKTERGAQKSATHESPKTEATPEPPHAPEKWLSKFDLKDFPVHELSGDANKFFYDPNIPKPSYKVNVDGIDFYFTGKIGEEGKRMRVLGYARIDGKLEPRYFHFSQSAANWHSAPGFESKRISKWEQWNPRWYEKGTVVGWKVAEALDGLPRIQYDGNIWKEWKDKVGTLNHPDDSPNDLMRSSRFRDFENRHTTDLSPKDMNNKITLDDLKDMRLDKNLDISFRWWFQEGPSMGHHLAFGQDVSTNIGRTTYGWKPVEVIFAWTKDRPDLVWIENILHEGVPVDSFGIPKRVFNGGLITAKPADYFEQVPEFMQREGKKLYVWSDTYVDMRPWLQDNPLVVQFKRLNGIRQAA